MAKKSSEEGYEVYSFSAPKKLISGVEASLKIRKKKDGESISRAKWLREAIREKLAKENLAEEVVS